MREPTAQEVADAVKAVLGPRARGGDGLTSGATLFPGRLLSARSAEALPPGTQAVRLAASAVVTPLARDILKKRGITVVLTPDASEATRGAWGFCLESSDGVGLALRRSLLARGEVWHEIPDSIAAFEWVRNAHDRGVVVVTRHAALRVWQACQVAGVRAGQACDAMALGRAIDDLAPNVLVLDGGSLSLWEVLQLCHTFRWLGIPARPVEEGSHENRRDHRPSDAGATAREPSGRSLVDRAAHAARGVAGGFNGAR
jgi:hypothetical protein